MGTTLAILVSLACAGAGAAGGAQPYTADSVHIKDGFVIVPVRVDETPTNFLLDTGSGSTFISTSLDDVLPRRERYSLSIGGKELASLPLPKRDVPPLALANLKAAPLSIGGVLGLDVLRHYSIGVDLEAKVLALWQQSASPSRAISFWFGHTGVILDRGAVWLPVGSRLSNPLTPSRTILGPDTFQSPRVVKLIRHKDWFAASLTVNGRTIEAVVDLGAEDTFLTTAVASEIPGLEMAHNVGAVGAEGFAQATAYKASEVKLDSLTLRPPPLIYAVPNLNGASAVIGTPVFHGSKLLFDFDGCLLYWFRKAK